METILEEAQRLVHGDRQASYGHPGIDYRAVGRMWAAMLERHFGFKVPDIDPRIAALMMVAVKLSREAGRHKRDNLVDAAGYAECVAMIAERQESADLDTFSPLLDSLDRYMNGRDSIATGDADRAA